MRRFRWSQWVGGGVSVEVPEGPEPEVVRVALEAVSDFITHQYKLGKYDNMKVEKITVSYGGVMSVFTVNRRRF